MEYLEIFFILMNMLKAPIQYNVLHSTSYLFFLISYQPSKIVQFSTTSMQWRTI
jgi:hypothetical protein